MQLVTQKITIPELAEMSKKMFGNLVKAVVDIEKKIMVVDADLHADEEAFLLENGSQQKDLWGINLYPEIQDENWIEFDSMINLRPSQNNRTRSVDDPKIQEQIIKIVNELVKRGLKTKHINTKIWRTDDGSNFRSLNSWQMSEAKSNAPCLGVKKTKNSVTKRSSALSNF
ncbi:MAG TPA: DUF5674 family protein [Candidatus Gracilibacteria bacterium]|nr:DUF5674 family protein [Candidatus Gracilibacteria bacterium]